VPWVQCGGELIIGEQADKDVQNYDNTSHFIDTLRSECNDILVLN
jgi:hypothetical protein